MPDTELEDLVEKTAIVGADLVLLGDSAQNNQTKRMTVTNLVTGIGPGMAAVTEKTTPVSGDEVVIADSAASDAIKRLSLTNFMLGVGPGVAALTNKATLVAGDDFVISDSADSDASKSATMTNVKDAVVNLWNVKSTIWIPATAMRPTVSNGCASLVDVETTSGRPDLHVLDFDQTSDEHAQFEITFPQSWNEGTITFQVWWAGLAATTGVAWALQGLAVSDNETIDAAYGTAIVVTDDAQGAVEETLVTAESAAVTIGGTPAADDICFFRLFRDVSDANDDMAGDARLLGVKVFFTVDDASDA